MKFLIKHKNNQRGMGEKGVAIILVVIAFVFFLAFFLLFLDFAYVYYVRGQLHNAADASALAGAAKIAAGPCTASQTDAINEAVAFAGKNTAGGGTPASRTVSLDTTQTGDGVYTDITFGDWNGTAFLPCPDATSVNAIQVTAQRTANYLTGDFGIVFGKLLNKTTVKIGGLAIAASGGGVATMPIPLCLPTVSGSEGQTNFASTSCPGKKYIFNPAGVEHCETGGGNVWDTYPPTSNPDEPNGNRIRDYLHNPQHVNLCGKCIDTTQGSDFPLSDIGPGGSNKGLKGIFEDNKGDATDKNGVPIVRTPGGATVQGWKVLVPILRPLIDCFGSAIAPQSCPGQQNVLYKVVGMSDAIITQVDDPPRDTCLTCKPTGSPYEVGITIIGTDPVGANLTQFRVLSCDNPDDVKKIDALAGRPNLVK
ncbi:MAG: hypothetical protein HY883_03610 [Deltaproteobacteria bacterium]|nr:hypothetical protein [Deltaproteobacteria bacterium]